MPLLELNSTPQEDLDRYQALVNFSPDFARKFFTPYYGQCKKYGDRQLEMALRLAATAYKNYLYLPFGSDENNWL